MTLKIKNLVYTEKWEHPTAGSINGSCYMENAELDSGINLVTSDLSGSGAALSYALTKGKSPKSGEFYVNDKKISLFSLKRMTSYIAFDELKKYRKYTFEELLRKSSRDEAAYSEITGFFLTDEAMKDYDPPLLQHRIEQLSHWIYLCSCMSEILAGRKILCFPWIPKRETAVQSYRLSLLAEYAQENDIIVIIPTETLDAETINGMNYRCKMI